MKAFTRGFGLALLMVTFLGLTGCSTDNESEAEKLGKAVGPPPKTDVKPADIGAPCEEHGRVRQATSGSLCEIEEDRASSSEVMAYRMQHAV